MLTHKCELTTEADAFMEWFHKTLSECVIAANAGTITRADGWGTARGRVPVDLSLGGNEYVWALENVYPLDWSAQRLDEMLTLERLHDSYSAPRIGYRAKRLPVTPARLEVDLYCAGAEIADVWRCLLAKLAPLTGTTPAVDQVTAVDQTAALTPVLQDWLFIIRQAEYERANHGVTFTDFCTKNGLPLPTFNGNKRKLKMHDTQAWQAARPTGIDDRVSKAIERRRETGWCDAPDIIRK